MIISKYDANVLGQAFGIDAGSIDGLGVGAGWARVAPGCRSDPHRHDETETFVIVGGGGDVWADGKRHHVSAGTVVQFEPFETHVIENTGTTELVFANFYWRDFERAVATAARPGRRRFRDRPIFVFSTPPTPNGDLHLGHLCGPYLGADVYVRFQRMNGASAWHITGTDDFQSYVADRARREGREPARTAAHYSAEIAATLSLMDITPDVYTATSASAGYQQSARAFFSRLLASGLVTRQDHPALFDPGTGAYLFEVDVTGGCPGCGADASGGICEECGEPNSSADLTDPRCASSGLPARLGSLTRYSIDVHEFRDAVYAHHRLGRVPPRIRELAGRVFTRPGLDVAITHPLPWGLPVPDDAGAAGQTVWAVVDVGFSLLFGIESLGQRLGYDWRADTPSPDWKIVHFFGFDNSFYNAIFVPVLYKIAFPGWAPDIDYNVNEFYRLEDSKFSTTRRHVIWGKDIAGPHSVDALRLFLSRTRPEGQGTNFKRDTYETFVSGTLIGGWQAWLNDLGERVGERYGGSAPDAGIWTPEHTAFLARLQARLSALTASLGPDGFSLSQAAAELLGLAEDARRFARNEHLVAATGGWQDEARTAVALELAAALLLARCAAPVMPRFAARLAAALGAAPEPGWPQMVALVPPGTPIDLARQTFFCASAGPAATTQPGQPATAQAATAQPGQPPTTAQPGQPGQPGQPASESVTAAAAAQPTLLPWLSDLIRNALQLPAGEPVANRKLTELGMASLQAVSVQYQVFEQLGVEITMEETLGDTTVADLAVKLAEKAEPEAVLATAEVAGA